MLDVRNPLFSCLLEQSSEENEDNSLSLTTLAKQKEEEEKLWRFGIGFADFVDVIFIDKYSQVKKWKTGQIIEEGLYDQIKIHYEGFFISYHFLIFFISLHFFVSFFIF